MAYGLRPWVLSHLSYKRTVQALRKLHCRVISGNSNDRLVKCMPLRRVFTHNSPSGCGLN